MSQFEINNSDIYIIRTKFDMEEPIDTYVPIVDTALHQLCSEQDLVYTNKIETEKYTEWNLALFDGHGTECGRNPYTGKFDNFNLTLLALQEMIETKQMDEILSRDIFGEEDSALAMQRALGKVCIDKKTTMISVGATMVHVKIRREFATKNITVDVLSVGDSVALIHHNGKRILQSVEHTPFNSDEIHRLFCENRIGKNSISPTGNFEMLDANTICFKAGKYVDVQGVKLAMTQSIGHIDYRYGEITEEAGIFGLAPYKNHMEFSESDNINIKLFSDGVSDVMNTEVIVDDRFFMIRSNATETADLAKSRWEKEWVVTSKVSWKEYVRTGEPFIIKNRHKVGADDISCVSWIGGDCSHYVANVVSVV
jgi:serine/threonine protein phosphatase PrpC